MKSNILASLISLIALNWGQVAIAADHQPPSRRFQDDPTTPIAAILNEWHQKHPEIPLFVCVCKLHECDSSERWPFRRFTFAEVIPALGDANRGDAETQGFGCVIINPHEM
ncbi:MAG: hypothetical protein F6J87_11025 [Spirulina sp. SIO3F2]|nr:hypothetical protein [Spirulina sp. SIO3F2]